MCQLTNRWSERVRDKVPSSSVSRYKMRARCETKRKRSLNVSMVLFGLHLVLLGLPIAAQTTDKLEIHAEADYADFIRAIAIPTALAETRPGDFVKFLRIGKNQDGEIVVRGIGLLSIDQHAPDADIAEDADVIVIAHVHHKLMNQKPVKEDALVVRRLGVPNFVISSDGQHIWEVGIVSGGDMYREISAKSIGQWVELK